jgi:hypothetical protein
MAVGFPVKDDYVTGDVLTAANMNDLSGTLNTITSANFAAGKNAIINGGFDIAQRGTSFTTGSITYTVDRWQIWSTGAGGNCVVTRVAGTSGAQYATEFGRQSGSSSLTEPRFAQTIETANSIQYAGKNIVVSFEALKGANYSGGDLSVDVTTGTGTDQNFTAFTGSATVTTTFTLTASNASYTTGAIAIPSNATEIALVFRYTATGTAGADDYVRLQKVQFELGSTESEFSRAGGTLQGELAACQRYYYRTTAESVYSVFGYGGSASTTIAVISIPFPVTMRTTPSSLDASAIAVQEDFVGGVIAATLTLAAPTKWAGYVEATVASGLTKYRPERILANNNAAAFLGFNAEL